ncbi:MAG: hypothetical protein HQK94_09145 [Nitrospirae bacterium]|nr:hypothetical protein [Nitrospirota bacterium]
MLKEYQYKEKGAATSNKKNILSFEEEAFLTELTELAKRRTSLLGELDELTQRLNKSDKDIVDGSNRLNNLNVEIAVREKETKSIDNEIFLLKRRRAAIGLPQEIEERFERQEATLEQFRAKQGTYSEEISGIGTSMHSFDTMMPEMETLARQTVDSINELTSRKDTLQREVLELEKVSTSFVEKAKFENELSTLTSSLQKYTEEIPIIKDHISNDEVILPRLKTDIQELEGKYEGLLKDLKEIETLLSERESFSKDIEKINSSNSLYSNEIQKLNTELTNGKESLQTLRKSSAANKGIAPELERMVQACEAEINSIRKSLALHDEIDRKKELAITNFLDAFTAKGSYENELQTFDGQMSKLIDIARSI